MSISMCATALFFGIVDDDVGRLPVAVRDLDDLEVERLAVERQALGAAVEQHRLARLQPELLAANCSLAVNGAKTSSL